ncbi:MAG: hypothetical protein ABSH35_24015 [Isosphaeraceae bacterium]|jgi:hypothetical protein
MLGTMAFPSNAAIDGVVAAILRPHYLVDWVGSKVYFEVRSTREWWLGPKAVRAAPLPGQVGGSSLFEDWPGGDGWARERMLDELSHPFIVNQ